MKCPNCGNGNREGARYCDSCGFDLAQVAAAPPEQAAPTDGDGAAPSAAAPPAAPPADAPETIAGRYVVRGFLRRGGRKDVYVADASELDREVAVAIFDTEGLAEAALARARREMQAMDRL